MTLILELDLDTIKIYQYTKDEVPNSRHLKVIAWTVFLAPVTLTLTLWPWFSILTQISWRCTFIHKKKFLAQGFKKLLPEQHKHILSSCDLDHDPMTLILEPNLHIMKMNQYTKNEFSSLRHSSILIYGGDLYPGSMTLTLTLWPWYTNLT